MRGVGVKFIDLRKQKFGRLTAVEVAGHDKHGKLLWRCVCECDGKETTVKARRLRNGHTQSCGCLRSKHGQARTGGRTPEYQAWCDAKKRCTNSKHPKYPLYGGRGIQVVARYLGPEGFENFLADVKEKPEPKRLYSIDRIDSDKNYEPGNLRWATASVQNQNRRCVKERLAEKAA